jgi:hypothetical protein
MAGRQLHTVVLPHLRLHLPYIQESKLQAQIQVPTNFLRRSNFRRGVLHVTYPELSHWNLYGREVDGLVAERPLGKFGMNLLAGLGVDERQMMIVVVEFVRFEGGRGEGLGALSL